MKCFSRLIAIVVVFVVFYSIFIHKAYAYLNPGSGSYIFQLIIGVLLGGLFTVKLFWNKIKVFLKDLFPRMEKHEKTDD